MKSCTRNIRSIEIEVTIYGWLQKEKNRRPPLDYQKIHKRNGERLVDDSDFRINTEWCSRFWLGVGSGMGTGWRRGGVGSVSVPRNFPRIPLAGWGAQLIEHQRASGRFHIDWLCGRTDGVCLCESVGAAVDCVCVCVCVCACGSGVCGAPAGGGRRQVSDWTTRKSWATGNA